jgi:CubicO group peptidase (beta-lactamase class C family)
MPRFPAQTKRARRFVLALVALIVFGGILGRTGLPPLWAPSVHRAVTRSMARTHIPGLSLSVVQNGKLRWSAGYGLADVENRVPARSETVYRWGSLSKPITATAVLQLNEGGKLDLDAPIQTFVPTFPQKPWPITSRQLLSHLGGIRHYEGDERESAKRYAHFRDAFPVFQNDPLICEPGTKHVYSTYGYNLLGAAVEEVSGAPFLGYLQEHIFRPARMTTARAADVEAIIPWRARGYARYGESLRCSRPVDLSNKTPGGGLCGTAVDAARFAEALMAGKLVRDETRSAMFTQAVTRDRQPTSYALGWSVTRDRNLREIWHSGRTQEASTLLYMIPERKFAVSILANLEDAPLLGLARDIAAAVVP